MKKDYYAILGITRDSDQACIRRAHRRAVLRTHPDLNEHASVEQFIEVQEAYEVLGDPAGRRRYDREMEAARRPRNAVPPRRPAYGGRAESFFEGHMSLASFIEALLNGRGFPHETRHAHGRDLYAEVVLTPAQAQRGTRVNLDVPIEALCGTCGGRGYDFFGVCSDCGGRGIRRGIHTVALSIPPGSFDGEELVFPLGRLGMRGSIRCVVSIQ